ncbi:(2Fe-2S)-binding protein [Kiloniella sp. b19]|uniref:(2Fe-2S)-binding protein n=1 Tax=Kiloniella sp. GXU_MW_B19 TaxID=3141326 RepID=UPI0031DBB3D2
MFRSLAKDNGPQVTVVINGEAVKVPGHFSVWAAMALCGQPVTRLSPVSSGPRSAYCAMGVCFECLVEIDGLPNQQACLHRVRDGMAINRQTIVQETGGAADA